MGAKLELAPLHPQHPILSSSPHTEVGIVLFRLEFHSLIVLLGLLFVWVWISALFRLTPKIIFKYFIRKKNLYSFVNQIEHGRSRTFTSAGVIFTLAGAERFSPYENS